jgi:hypothetical protein
MKITYKFYKGTPFIFYFFLFGGESRKKFLVLKKESSLAAWRVYHHVFIIVLLPLSESREREDMATKTPKLVKHTLLARFNDEITREQIDNYINDYTDLLDLVPTMKSFSW